GDRECRTPHLIEAPAPLDSHVDVHATRAGRLGPSNESHVLEYCACHMRHLSHLWPLDTGHWIEIDAQFVRVIQIVRSYRVWVKLQAGEIGEPGQRGRVARYDFIGRAS